MTGDRTLALYVGAFVDELTRAGVCQAVVSPGSRSTPLAMMMAEHPEMKVWMHLDERSAGYFALGMAKALRSPVALLCSSGTAAANYMPAVVEAYQARIPLIVCTADRPHELRDVGAPQAIDQIGLYGKYAKWFVEMALPDDSPAMLRYARTMAGRAAGAASSGPAGPVHLNFPFREPLVPQLSAPEVWQAGRIHAERGRYVAVEPGVRRPREIFAHALAFELAATRRGLIVCGPHDDPMLADAVIQLAERLGYPVLADPLSQLRSGPHSKQWIIDSYDSFLRHAQIDEILAPDVMIRFGAMPVSKALMQFVKRHPACRQLVVDEDQGWREPTLLASGMIFADPVEFCASVVKALAKQSVPSFLDAVKPVDKWAGHWMTINWLAQEELLKAGYRDERFEGQVFLELLECLPDQAALYVGNSMPVRDLDTFFLCNERSVRVFANRGANGIDGVVSSALGVSAAWEPLVLVIGDLSFFHDLNGLLAARLHRLNATIVLINNDGGGIFSFLPQAQHPAHFETLFGTPLGLDYKHAVEMYGGSFQTLNDWSSFRQAVKDGISTEGLTVLEIRTERARNVEIHRLILQAVGERISRYLAEERLQ